MATVKTTKKTKAAVEIKSIDQLRTDLAEAHVALIDARKGNRLGELTNPRFITVTRKKIAQINTAIRAIEIKEQKETK